MNQKRIETAIRVTAKQNAYLMFLADGAKMAKDFRIEFGVTAKGVNKILCKLRNNGLVWTERAHGTRGNVYNYMLTAPYSELDLIIGDNASGAPIEDVEVLYAAILRNGFMTGQQLKDQYRKLFPHRSPGAISNIVMTARTKGLWGRKLCR